MKRARFHAMTGFTLIELLAASLAAALILAAVYGVFQRAVKARDNSTERLEAARRKARTAEVIRNDLRGALVSGVFASALEGSAQNRNSKFPGYLRFTTTTGKNRAGESYGDVQQVEYYLVEDGSSGRGVLTRVLTRDLLAAVREASREEELLDDVESFEIGFYDGRNWQESWLVSEASPSFPQAIRVRVRQAAPSGDLPAPLPLEICVPWRTMPWPDTSGATTGTSA